MTRWPTRFRHLRVPLTVVVLALVVAGGRAWAYAPWLTAIYWGGAVLLLLSVLPSRRRGR
jgi:hypothetical protein